MVSDRNQDVKEFQVVFSYALKKKKFEHGLFYLLQIFLIIVRALQLLCRLVLSLQPIPLKETKAKVVFVWCVKFPNWLLPRRSNKASWL